MRFTSYLAAAVLAASSAPSWAELSERWVRVAAGGDATMFMDTVSLRRNGAIVKAWVITNYSSPHSPLARAPTERNFSSERALELFDCAKRSIGQLQFSRFSSPDGEGDSVRSWSSPGTKGDFKEVAPETLGEAALSFACSQRMPAPAIERRQSRPAVQEISAPMVAGQGGGKTVEQTVAQIASDYNDGPAKADDRMIAWSSAKAAGKEVIFTNVLRLRPNLSADELKQFREASIPDVTRQTCALPGNHIGFDRGMVYTFVYLSQSNQDLMRFSVDRKICALAK